MILLQNVSKVYANGIHALRDINLEVPRQEFVFLVGVSGAGKSTLVRLLIREELPSTGAVIVAGHNVLQLSKRHLAHYRRKVSIIFQDFRLLPNKTVTENVAMALRVAHHPQREIDELVPEALELVGLTPFAENFPLTLSGGEQQRVAIARAVVRKPDVLIADEPTGNLDPVTSAEIVDLLMHINGLGTTVVMATHDKEMVNRARLRVVELVRGEIVRDELRGTYQYGRS
ncbi:MAG: cell division ATP-binding protein FtsE [Chloroflexi bacterium]|nr:cell division ATP-binding protein FtsE [Chloroflexota bacterium]